MVNEMFGSWALIAAGSMIIGIFFGLMGFFFSDRNENFLTVSKQIFMMSGVGGAVVGVFTLLFFYKGANLDGVDFAVCLGVGALLCGFAGFLTVAFGRKCYFLMNPVAPDERLRPPRT